MLTNDPGPNEQTLSETAIFLLWDNVHLFLNNKIDFIRILWTRKRLVWYIYINIVELVIDWIVLSHQNQV